VSSSVAGYRVWLNAPAAFRERVGDAYSEAQFNPRTKELQALVTLLDELAVSGYRQGWLGPSGTERGSGPIPFPKTQV
tara:strand:+ start:1967 stop:2200 length:234 start_codon:yes stop_codon:yes gene_type:complete